MLLIFGLATNLNCGQKESKEEREISCKKACENVAHITLEDLDRKVGSGQEGATSTTRMKPEGAQRIYQQIKRDCIATCTERGTTKKIECFQAATAKSDVAACR